jgi:CRP-like cAMP-binding protein
MRLTGPDYLAGVSLFAGLKEKDRKEIQKLGHVVFFPFSHRIITKGNPDLPSLHVVLEGSVRVVDSGRTIGRLGVGECFGELALIDDEPRSADVIAGEPTRCFVLPGFAFHKYLHKHPVLAINMLKALARRLRASSGLFSATAM